MELTGVNSKKIPERYNKLLFYALSEIEETTCYSSSRPNNMYCHCLW